MRSGGFGFVQTAEGEFFIPETKMAGAFDGDLVEIAPLAARPASGAGARDRGQDQEHAKRSGALPAPASCGLSIAHMIRWWAVMR